MFDLGTLIALKFLLLGALLVLLSLRGRRINDHPICRKCRFDLFGLTTPEQCPECGAQLNQPRAVRIGERRPRKRILWFGVVVFVSAVAVITTMTWERTRDLKWMQIKPTQWLIIEVRYFNATDDLDELLRRMKADALSDQQEQRVIELGLAAQRDQHKWDARWGRILARLLIAGEMNGAQQKRYLQQAFEPGLTFRMRRRVGLDDPIPYELVSEGLKPVTLPLLLRCEKWSARIGEIEADCEQNAWVPVLTDEPAVIAQGFVRLPSNKTVSIVLSGRYTVSVRLGLKAGPFAWGDDLPDFELSRTTHNFQTEVELVHADELTAKMIVDDRMRNEMAQSVKVEESRSRRRGVRPRNISNMIKLDAMPPTALAVDIIARHPGGETFLGRASSHSPDFQFSTKLSTPFEYLHGHRLKPIQINAEKVDLILRPSYEAAIRSVWITEYWGEEILIKDVPIIRFPR